MDDAASIWVSLGLLSVPILVVINGLFVAAEFSLIAVRKTRVQELVQQGVIGSSALAWATSDLNRSIGATQLGITLASIALGWTGEPALAHLLSPLFVILSPGWSAFAAHSVATVLALIAITAMHVVFGELVPKTVALQTPDRIALLVAHPLMAFAKISRPLIVLLNSSATATLRLFGYPPGTGAEMIHSVEELALLIEDTEEAGLLDADQAELVQNVFRLSNKRVGDCLVPSEKMASLELSTPSEKILEAVRASAHTRMPVYEGDPNNIVGIVNTKDLFHLFSLQGVVVLQDALYPALFLGPDQTIGQALRLFKKAHRPMALVRDSDERILGLITLEDVLEEIVGDIEDEHDRPPPKRVLRKIRQLSAHHAKPKEAGPIRASAAKTNT